MDSSDDPPPEFDVFLPLPMRVALLLILGIWGFGANLQRLEASGADTDTLFQFFRSSSSTSTSANGGNNNNNNIKKGKYYQVVYQLAGTASGILFACWWLYHIIDPDNLDGILPTIILVLPLAMIIIIIIIAPIFSDFIGNKSRFLRRVFIAFIPTWSTAGNPGRLYTARVFLRIGRASIDLIHPGARFIDILAADVLTSYSKVFGEFYAIGCIISTSHNAAQSFINHPTRQCGHGNYVIPIIVALPYLIRFRQCLLDYQRNGGNTPILNALKYASSFPVIFLPLILPNNWSGIWLLSVFINSGYSFYWDVTMDWGLSSLIPGSSASTMRKLHFTNHPFLYYLAIVSDLGLRFVWSIRLSPRLYRLAQHEMGIFLLQLAELFRRWVWVFFRAENEFILISSNNSLPSSEHEIELMDNNIELPSTGRPAFKAS